MKKPRKQRTDTTDGMLAAHTKQEVITWPGSVTPFPDKTKQRRARSEFEGILESRVANDWPPNQITLAAQLAQTIIQHDSLNQQIESEGAILAGAANPGLAILNQFHQKTIKLSQALGITGTQRDSRSVANAGREKRLAKAAYDEHPLLAH